MGRGLTEAQLPAAEGACEAFRGHTSHNSASLALLTHLCIACSHWT